MDKGKYFFKVLDTSYGHFMAPECEITIGSKTLKDSKVDIEEVEVEQAADGAAGSCRIKIVDFYNYHTSSWDSALTSNLKVGAKLSVKMGYVKKKEVFFGYVDDFSFEYGEDEEPAVVINGLDGLGFLMHVRSRMFAGEKKTINNMVADLLRESMNAGASKKSTISPKLKDITVQRILEGQDTYSFLNTLAKQTGMQLLCINGELIFDDVESYTTPVCTLDMMNDGGLFSFSKRLSLANQPGKVIVHGRDINNKPIKGEATSSSLSGSGTAAASVASKLLKKAVYEEESPLVMTAEECKKLAQNRFDDLARNYVHGSGMCVGLPEICAGRYLELKGMDRSTDGSYFLTRVVHTLNDDGYFIKFEVRGAKSK